MQAGKSYIEKLIEQGEHQKQDFKFAITDSKKIARTLAAFSNTDGGRLLVGVKDNGVPAGVRSEEEVHMLQAAGQLYCHPEVQLNFTQWQLNDKKILEVAVPKMKDALVSAPDKNGHFKVYLRVGDENILANGIFIKNWEQRKQGRGVRIQYTEMEMMFLRILREEKQINWSQLRKRMNVSPADLNRLLLDFMAVDVVTLLISEKGYFYRLKSEQLTELKTLR